MAQQPIPYSPVAGISYGETPFAIAENQVQNSLNWCYDGRYAWTRPGLKRTVVSGTGLGQVRMAASLRVEGTPYSFFITFTNKLFSLDQNGVATEITGAGFTMASNPNNDTYCVVSDEVLIGNCSSGLIQWVAGAASYSISTSPKYAYVTSHFSRAVAANATPGFGSIRQVAWSVPGDPSDWTSTIDGAGSALLTDAPDGINGLANVQNTLVVARRYGFHLGYATGVANPAFRFEMYSQRDVGVYRGGSVGVTADTMFFIGQDNVYSFDTNRIVAIGDDIRQLLFEGRSHVSGSAERYIKMLGFISRRMVSGEAPRATYNIVQVPDGQGPANWPFRHFALDIQRGIWECHEYEDEWGFAWESHPNNTDSTISFVDRNSAPSICSWDGTIACERAAVMHGRNLVIGMESDDASLDRALLKWQDRGPARLKFTVSSDLSENEISHTADVLLGSEGRRGRWSRTWINGLRSAGNGWEYRIETVPGTSLAISQIIGMFGLSGEYRGASPTP